MNMQQILLGKIQDKLGSVLEYSDLKLEGETIYLPPQGLEKAMINYGDEIIYTQTYPGIDLVKISWFDYWLRFATFPFEDEEELLSKTRGIGVSYILSNHMLNIKPTFSKFSDRSLYPSVVRNEYGYTVVKPGEIFLATKNFSHVVDFIISESRSWR